MSQPPCLEQAEGYIIITHVHRRNFQNFSFFKSVEPLEMFSAVLSQKYGPWQESPSREPAASICCLGPGTATFSQARPWGPASPGQQDGTSPVPWERTEMGEDSSHFFNVGSCWPHDRGGTIKALTSTACRGGDAKGFLFSQTPRAPRQGGNL